MSKWRPLVAGQGTGMTDCCARFLVRHSRLSACDAQAGASTPSNAPRLRPAGTNSIGGRNPLREAANRSLRGLAPRPSFPRKRESRTWIPACAGVTNRSLSPVGHSRAFQSGACPRMLESGVRFFIPVLCSRLRRSTKFPPACCLRGLTPSPSFPRRRESTAGSDKLRTCALISPLKPPLQHPCNSVETALQRRCKDVSDLLRHLDQMSAGSVTSSPPVLHQSLPP